MKKHVIVFLNGQWIEADDSLLTGLTPGVVRGQGVFETFLIHQGRVVFWDEHLSRLRRGLKAYRIKSPYSMQRLKTYTIRAIELNHLTSGRLRLAVFRDEGQVFVSIVAQAVRGSTKKTFRVEISPYVRKFHRYSHLKSVDYEPFYSARSHAVSQGVDEAILLNPKGHVVEGAISNVFWFHKGRIVTPAVRCGCLNGITRQWIIRTAKEMGIPVHIGEFRIGRLKTAEEIFLTNSAMGIKPVTELDRQSVPHLKSGVTSALLAIWKKCLNA